MCFTILNIINISPRIQGNTIMVIKMLLVGKTVEQISNQLQIPVNEVVEIKNEFESN